MGMTIEDIKHCLKVMIDCEVCEECNLYGTTGTDHCEHDCVYGALDIIEKYQKIKQLVNQAEYAGENSYTGEAEWILADSVYQKIREILEDGDTD